MKNFVLAAWFLCVPGGDRDRGLALYREGHFAEAAAAFRAALESEGDSAELQWNLALALWRAGELPAAEQAVERYAAQAGDRRADLHSGLLGAIRYAEAKAIEGAADEIARAGPHATPPSAPAPGGPPPAAAPADPLPLLEQALDKARQAKDYFVRGGTGVSAAPEVARNAERALRYVGELEKKIEELKKQREQQKKDDDKKQDKDNQKKDDDKKQDDKKDDQQKDQQKQDQQKKPDEQKSDDQKQQDQKQEQPKPDEKSDPSKDKPGEPKPEPKPEEHKPEQKPEQQQGKDETEPKPGEQQQEKPQPKPDQEPPKDKPEEKPAEAKPRTDAPGEQQEGKELTPEQKARLFEQIENLDQQLKAIRARAQQGRRPVERDW